jgi:hypothetical protein
LIHLDGTLCAPRRCFECPIAHQVVVAEHAVRQAPQPLPLPGMGSEGAGSDQGPCPQWGPDGSAAPGLRTRDASPGSE